MIKTIILFVAAVVVAILLGMNIGRRKGFISGYLRGKEETREWWKNNLPKEAYHKAMHKQYENLMKFLREED